ncbi:unnamed protein product [Urochloa decumbens]|uniref:DUF7036 domain-containing protein n=1 Tax=Urochloa decumbens TaxID=240449 RepID=A0ABC9ECE7_9POAL
MGKAGRTRTEQAFPNPNAAPVARFSHCRCGAVVDKVISAKCLSVLLLAVGGFLSPLFMLLHLRASGGGVPDDPDIVAEIEAGFILLVPHSQIASQRGTLEKEIYNQVGVPNSKVSLSMHPYNYTDTTYVKFGVLPDPRNTSMSKKSINTLRTSLIRLTLQQLNLSLTPSVFGDPLCLEILGFPGGITVLLPHNDSHSDSIQHIFNITFDSTIREVREFLEEMKNELAKILQQTPDEVNACIFHDDSSATVNMASQDRFRSQNEVLQKLNVQSSGVSMQFIIQKLSLQMQFSGDTKVGVK